MSEAPETIWIDACGGNWSPVSGGTQGEEYRRADLVPQWQTIETAPKDGAEFIAYLSYGNISERTVMFWHDGEEDWTNTSGAIIGAPTHWMPLPEPPTT